MLNIRRWLEVIPSISIFRNDFKLYQKWKNCLLIYYLKNIKTVNDAVKSIQYICNEGYETSDKIMDRLSYIYSIYLPSETDLAKLSLLYQSVIDTYGIEEYAILTLWISAIQAIIDAENKINSE
jgi:hypothetical protein